MDISFNSSLPNLEKYDVNLNQFNSFKHKSILDLEEEVEKSKDISLDNLHFKSSNISVEETQSDSDSYHSLTDSEEMEYEKISEIPEASKSKPIDIVNKRDDSYFVDKNEYDTSYRNESHMFYTLKNDYVLVNPNKCKTMSEPTKNLSSSFREYFNNSLNFIRQSYNYISSNNKSI